MTTDTAARLALGLYAVGVACTFGLRTWLHMRRTGHSGYKGVSGTRGSAEWWGGILFVAALLLAAAGPALAVAGLVTAPAGAGGALGWVGAIVAIVGFLAVLLAQSGMGSSWRIGVDRTEVTGLVTTSMFAVVRNPIFTAMATALLGLTLLVPTAVSAAALVCLIAAIELQVRVVEEPYLARTHGVEYLDYTRRVGRFFPGVGRARPSGTVHTATHSQSSKDTL
ncbi:isoprenylcysteine carboxylmethyltransferase family protein [Cellulomonas humilata]|uniref:Isoprenylcysteine carboxylmethyltransferase family protein n=1 Tax=Cellulomonas humilata TaxID=144055 RepID=A0A7Y5ZZH2_9CELL|nr:isoprenylcysteine carboxylmethyltransferase family protein [Cellulomonas humilata]NUU17006.1 isoprenylcysteine carboxylmethyltransferase family protein [Cellulomonas humilata]